MSEREEKLQMEAKTLEKKSRKRKKQIKKKKREERLAGLIFLIITLFIGFVLWVSGEVKERKVEEGIKLNNDGVVILK